MARLPESALIARIIAEYGGSLLAVHARTKEQGHQGEPDLRGVAEIKRIVDIPVIGNGGVKQVSDIQTMQEITGCDGVMIGRAAIHNPWIFSKLNRDEILVNQVQEVMLDHLERSLSFHGQEKGLILFRKFAASYLAPYFNIARTEETASDRIRSRKVCPTAGGNLCC